MQRLSLASCTGCLSGLSLPGRRQHVALDLLRTNPSTEPADGYSPPRFSVEALLSTSTLGGTGSVTARGYPHPSQGCWRYCHPHFLTPNLPPPAICQSAWQLWDVTRQGVGWDHPSPSPSWTPPPPPGLSLSSPMRCALPAWKDSAHPPSIGFGGCWTRFQCKVNELRWTELGWGIFFSTSEMRVRVHAAFLGRPMQQATSALKVWGLWLCCKTHLPDARKGAQTFDVQLILRINVWFLSSALCIWRIGLRLLGQS